MTRAEKLAEEYATLIRHSLRADGTEREQIVFDKKKFEHFIAGARAGIKMAAKVAEKNRTCTVDENTTNENGLVRCILGTSKKIAMSIRELL